MLQRFRKGKRVLQDRVLRDNWSSVVRAWPNRDRDRAHPHCFSDFYTTPVRKFVALSVCVVHVHQTCRRPLSPLGSSTSPPPGTVLVLQFPSGLRIAPPARLGYSSLPDTPCTPRTPFSVSSVMRRNFIAGHVLDDIVLKLGKVTWARAPEPKCSNPRNQKRFIF